MTKVNLSPRKIKLNKFLAGLRATRLKKIAVKTLLQKTRQPTEVKLTNQEIDPKLPASTPEGKSSPKTHQIGFQLIDRRSEMSESTHPADDDPPPVYTAEAFQNCLDVGNSWLSVVFLDQLNLMKADEFFDAICNTTCCFGGEGYWWQDLSDRRYLAERRQCIAFNLRRFDLVASSNKDYLSAMADSFEDAQQLWRNKTRHLTPEQQGEFRLTTMTKKDRKKALAVAESIRQRIEEMERDPERQYADNFIGVLNLTRADLVNTYGSVWMSKSQYSRDLMGSSRFVISRTTVAPKATQSEPDAPIAGTLVLTKPMVTWLQITYGMDEEFLANRSPSWVTWLDQQRLDGVDPNDAMLVAPFVPDFNEVLPPHLPEPVLVPEVYRQGLWSTGRWGISGLSVFYWPRCQPFFI
jgi:hypothetical protein